MSVSGVGSSTDPYQTGLVQPNTRSKLQSDFTQLSDALGSGNLAQAQQAFTTLKGDLPAGATTGNSPIAATLNTIGQALQTGDISTAQQAFAAMQQQGRTHHGRHHHKVQDSDGDADGSTGPTAAATAAAGATGTSGVGSILTTFA